MAGEAVRLLGSFGRRYAVAVRVATLPPIAAIALLRVSDGEFAATALTVAVAVVWTCGQGWWLRRKGTVPVALDAAVLLGLCLSVFWTGAAEDTNLRFPLRTGHSESRQWSGEGCPGATFVEVSRAVPR